MKGARFFIAGSVAALSLAGTFLLKNAGVIGQVKPDLDEMKQRLGYLRKAGNYAEAIPLAEQILAATEAQPGAQATNVAVCLQKMAELHCDKGDYAKAMPLQERVAAICEKVYGPGARETANTLNDLACTLQSLGELDKAEAALLRALKAYQSALGERQGDPNLANTLNNLAGLYQVKGDLKQARVCGERCLQMREAMLDRPSREIAQSLSNLGAIYREMGEYALALQALGRALEINVALGTNHDNTCANYFQLARFHYDRGESAAALPQVNQALGIADAIFPRDHPTKADILSLKGAILLDMDQYAEAETAYQQALAISLHCFGEKHHVTASVQNNLGLLYRRVGDFSKAEAWFLKALATEEEVEGERHPALAAMLLNLASVHEEQERFQEAEKELLKALHLHETTFGSNHLQVARNLNNLGMFYLRKHEPDNARPFLLRGLDIYQKSYGTNNQYCALMLNSLAIFHESRGDYGEAETVCRQALDIFERVLGQEHSHTGTARKHLARLKIDGGDREQAVSFARQVAQVDEKMLANVLRFTSEQQRLIYQQQQDPCWLLASLGMARDLAVAVFHNKGIVLDSLLDDRAAAATLRSGRGKELLEQRRDIKERLSRLFLVAPRDQSNDGLRQRAVEQEELMRRTEQLDSELARMRPDFGRARRALSVTVEQVQSKLPDDTVLVEFIRYSEYQRRERYEARYGAIVLGSVGDPKWIRLDSTTNIDKNVSSYKSLAPKSNDQAALTGLLQDLYQQLWLPFQPALPPGTKSVIIAPDAELNFVSFATLLAPNGQFLGEQYSLRYVTTGRDLLFAETTSGHPTNLVVFANPDFGAPVFTGASLTSETADIRLGRMRALRGLRFDPLPGSEKEAALLCACARALGFQKVTPFLGKEATKAELWRVESPYALHLATHGFWLPDVESSAGQPKDGSPTPPRVWELGRLARSMFRSGFALAGAQRTVDSFRKGIFSETGDDGIVTAEEVAGLRLSGTWLVVLSACETGQGEAQAGEGVFGLRRGFVQAGARNLLQTLWAIDDEKTARIIMDFYAAAMKTGDAPNSLAEVQRNWLVKLRAEKGVAEACKIAGPFILTFQGLH